MVGRMPECRVGGNSPEGHRLATPPEASVWKLRSPEAVRAKGEALSRTIEFAFRRSGLAGLRQATPRHAPSWIGNAKERRNRSKRLRISATSWSGESTFSA